MTRRTLTLLTVAAVLTAISVTGPVARLGQSTPSHQTAVHTNTAPGTKCATLDHLSYISTDGVEHPDNAPGRATAYHWAIPDGYGTLEQEIHPPDGFDPRTATDATLTAFGIGPRPRDQIGLTAWNARYANFSRFVQPQAPCLTGTRSGPTVPAIKAAS